MLNRGHFVGWARWLVVAAGLIAGNRADAQSAAAQSAAANLLPRPLRAELMSGSPFVLPDTVRIVIPSGTGAMREVAELLATELSRKTGLTTRVVREGTGRLDGIHLDTLLASANAEAYELEAGAQSVFIRGASAAGARWGAQTLLQLLEPSVGRGATSWSIAAVRISDAPRFGWRGSMVDVGRHFLPVRDIERHIDLLSRYKMNTLHWHLTDDQGWRIEIKRYPRLTSVGAWRREADGSRYGGFYTQAQVRSLVEYARHRGVTIVPEIEMPGHSSAALAAYPQLGCTDARIEVPTTWGVFADVYCAGKEETFTFLFGVLDEVMDLFPSPVIHLGGDEVPKDRWKACAVCQAVMTRERLANEEELQSWFMRRVAAHVAQRGRTVMGWDEVLDGPYVPGGMVQSWRDSLYTRKAVERGFDVVASPSDFTYLNRSAAELTVAGVYGFDPMPHALGKEQAARVRGGEVPLWSEHIVSGANLELMALPRLLAFAEVLWSGPSRDVGNLQRRLEVSHVPALRSAGYAVGPADQSIASVAVRYDSIARRPMLSVRSLADGIVMRGTTDGSRPTSASRRYVDGATLAAARTVRLQAFWGARPVLEERRVTMVRHNGIGARVRTTPAVDARYPGTGPWSLADGLLGSTEHGDGLWQGWWVPDVDVTLELAVPTDVARLQVDFLQNVRSWIVLPATVAFSFSLDGVEWSAPLIARHDVPVSREGAVRQPFAVAVPSGRRVRFIRVQARSAGPLPAGHPGAGQPAWLFADEVLVTARRPQSVRQRGND
ncbi:MAG: beta-N-acetylhexosaminidase [Gemmatimonadaceae bacterium]|nr:beta-N-acetylhexosaminidase [Gemmatimonadaceae bacterium]